MMSVNLNLQPEDCNMLAAWGPHHQIYFCPLLGPREGKAEAANSDFFFSPRLAMGTPENAGVT